jgi:hypothetical protein
MLGEGLERFFLFWSEDFGFASRRPDNELSGGYTVIIEVPMSEIF